MSYKPGVTRANSARSSIAVGVLAMAMSMRTTGMGMAGQVAMRVVCRNPVTAATPDHPRFMGAFLIDGMALAQS
jgi:hypothetical protein